MRLLLAAVLLTPLLLAGSAPAESLAQPLNQALRQARAEEAAAEADAARLENVAARARGEAERLRAEQAAAAQAIEAAEANITAADAAYRLAAASVAVRRERLAQQQQPVSALLAGLAIMARRPPLMALADSGGTDEFVKVSVLLDSTLPVIRSRTKALSGALADAQRLQSAAISARADLLRSRQQLATRREQFAQLEQRAVDRSIAAGGHGHHSERSDERERRKKLGVEFHFDRVPIARRFTGQGGHLAAFHVL